MELKAVGEVVYYFGRLKLYVINAYKNKDLSEPNAQKVENFNVLISL